jgi:hypothetical protein
MEIKKLTSWPAAFDAMARKINEIVVGIKPPMNIKASNGVKVTVSDNDILIQGDGTGGGSGMPSGSTGDMLYHDGSDWVVLAAPTVSVAAPVLRHDGTAPYWEEPESC